MPSTVQLEAKGWEEKCYFPGAIFRVSVWVCKERWRKFLLKIICDIQTDGINRKCGSLKVFLLCVCIWLSLCYRSFRCSAAASTFIELWFIEQSEREQNFTNRTFICSHQNKLIAIILMRSVPKDVAATYSLICQATNTHSSDSVAGISFW